MKVTGINAEFEQFFLAIVLVVAVIPNFQMK